MAYSNGLITKPISIDDIKIALGVWDNRLSVLCKSPQINMWSRYKPVSKAKLFDMMDSDFASVNYGITIPDSITSVQDLFATASPWIYTKPSGGAPSPYRKGDFVGYYPAAVPPIVIRWPEEPLKTNQSTTYQNYVFSPVFTFNQGADNWNEYCLALANVFALPSYQDLYPSLVFYTPSTGKYSIVTTDKTINELANSSVYASPFVVNIINAHFAGYAEGTEVQVAPCLQSNKYTSITENFNPAYYVSLNFRNNQDKKIYSLIVDKSTLPPTPPTPVYNLSFSYTRTGSYTYSIDSVTITNTNNVAGTVDIIGTIAGQNVTYKNTTLKSNVLISGNGSITITSFDGDKYFSALTDCQGGLVVSLTGDAGTSKTLVLPGAASGTV